MHLVTLEFTCLAASNSDQTTEQQKKMFSTLEYESQQGQNLLGKRASKFTKKKMSISSVSKSNFFLSLSLSQLFSSFVEHRARAIRNGNNRNYGRIQAFVHVDFYLCIYSLLCIERRHANGMRLYSKLDIYITTHHQRRVYLAMVDYLFSTVRYLFPNGVCISYNTQNI